MSRAQSLYTTRYGKFDSRHNRTDTELRERLNDEDRQVQFVINEQHKMDKLPGVFSLYPEPLPKVDVNKYRASYGDVALVARETNKLGQKYMNNEKEPIRFYLEATNYVSEQDRLYNQMIENFRSGKNYSSRGLSNYERSELEIDLPRHYDNSYHQNRSVFGVKPVVPNGTLKPTYLELIAEDLVKHNDTHWKLNIA